MIVIHCSTSDHPLWPRQRMTEQDWRVKLLCYLSSVFFSKLVASNELADVTYSILVT